MRKIVIKLTRDSACAGDDVNAPHDKRFSLPPGSTLRDFLGALAGSGYLPRIAGTQERWVATVDGRVLCSFGKNPLEAKYTLAPATPLDEFAVRDEVSLFLMLIGPKEKVLVTDYNGTGRWSAEEVMSRYAEHVRRLHVDDPIDLTPREYAKSNQRWIYPVMETVIEGIEAGDAACIELGVEFIVDDPYKLPFGRILKWDTARALRRCGELNDGQTERLRKQIVGMLLRGMVPREYQEYSRLLRKVGIGEWWQRIDAEADRSNPQVMKFYEYYRKHLIGERT